MKVEGTLHQDEKTSREYDLIEETVHEAKNFIRSPVVTYNPTYAPWSRTIYRLIYNLELSKKAPYLKNAKEAEEEFAKITSLLKPQEELYDELRECVKPALNKDDFEITKASCLDKFKVKFLALLDKIQMELPEKPLPEKFHFQPNEIHY